MEWPEPESESRAVLALENAAGDIELSPLAPGELELSFYDTDDQVRNVSVELQEGENSLAIDTAEMEFRPAGPIQVAALEPVTVPAPRQLALPGTPSSELLLGLEPDTDIFLDGQYFGNSGTTGQSDLVAWIIPKDALS